MQQRDQPDGSMLSPDDVPMPFAELAPDGQVLACNAALLDLLGYDGTPADQLPEMAGLIPPEWRPGTARAGHKPAEVHFSAKLPAKDGTRISVEVFVRRINDRLGLPSRFRASVLDTTTIREMEAGLIRVEQQSSVLTSVLEELKTPVFATDEQSRIVYANAAAAQLCGRPADEIAGERLWDAYPVSQHDLLYRMYQRALQESRTLSCDHFSQLYNLWYEVRFFHWMGGGLIMTLSNITARKQYERFMGLAAYTVNKLSDYVFWLSENGKIVRANDVASKALRFPDNPHSRVHFSEVSRVRPDEWAKIWREIKEKGSITVDTALLQRDGNDIPAEASVSYANYVGQEYAIVIARDISARLKADDEIRRAREQAELYLDLMSHDIRNINQIGAGFLEIAIEDPAIREDERELLKKPLEAFERSSELIGNVKKLQQAAGTLAMEEIELSAVLRDVVAHYADVQGRDVSIDLQIEGNCSVRANKLLTEVFSNLVANAIKHSKGRVRVGIALNKVIVADRPCCEVVVEDNGPGIPDEVKAKLFSTRRVREKGVRSRGLGLILVKSLLDDFGGSVVVEDRVPGDQGQGARFIVTLPVA